MEKIKNIALVAHDNRKKDLIEWFEYNYRSLIKHKLVCTGTTGRLVEEALQKKLGEEKIDFRILRLKSGPLMEERYAPVKKNFEAYIKRDVDLGRVPGEELQVK